MVSILWVSSRVSAPTRAAAPPQSAMAHRSCRHPIDIDGLGKAFQAVGAQIVQFEQPVDQDMGGRADYDRIRCGHGLQPRRQVWRDANDGVGFQSFTAPHFACNHQSGVNADPNGEGDIKGA